MTSPLDFPSSPTTGQTYPSPPVSGQPVYTWNGFAWTTIPTPAVVSSLFVAKAGDTMTGGLLLPSATVTASTPSTSTTTGALVVTGGVGIGGAVNAGGAVTVTNGSGLSLSATLGATFGTVPPANAPNIVTVNGTNAGTGGAGSCFSVQNGGVTILAAGNKSGVIGGAYDATPYIYGKTAVQVNNDLNVQGQVISSGGGSGGLAAFNLLDRSANSQATVLYRNNNVTFLYDSYSGESLICSSNQYGNVGTNNAGMQTNWWGGFAGFAGNTSNGWGISAYYTGGPSSGAYLARVDNTAAYMMAFYYSGAFVGSISTNGSTVSFNTTSDARLKTDQLVFDGTKIIAALKPYNFKWKKSGLRSYGVFAQEVEEVFPEAVHHNEETDSYGVDYSKFVPVLIRALQQATERITALEAR